MKIRGRSFWIFEAMMLFSAITTCIMFQLIIAILSGKTYSVTYQLYWMFLLSLPHLLGGMVTWQISRENNNWVELARRQIFFANFILIISTLFFSMFYRFHNTDITVIMIYNIIYAMCSMPSIMVCCYLYHVLSNYSFTSHKK